MFKKCIVFFFILLFWGGPSLAQKRKTIDRSTPHKEVNKDKQTSSSSKTNTTRNVSKKDKPVQQSYFNISSQSASFGSEGGTRTFTVSSSGSWKVSVNPASWGHLTRNGNTLTLTVDANTGTSSRTDFFKIESGSKSLRVDISQSRSSLSVSSDYLQFNSSGGTLNITIYSSETWRIGTNTASWGHLTKNGNSLSVRIDENTNTTSRTDWFTIKSGTSEKRINISQNGKTISNTPKTASIKTVSVYNDADVDGKKGLSVHVAFDISGMKDMDGKVSCYFYDGNGNALIDTNGKYGTDGSPSHVASSKSIKPGYENTTYSDLVIKIPYDELHISGTYSRSMRVDVIIWDYSTSNHKEITRKQRTSFTCNPNYSILKVNGVTSGLTTSFGQSGGREYYTVSSGTGSYDIWGVPAWCSVENKSSSGFTLVCNQNTSSSSRSDYMKVMTSNQEIRIDIKQEAGSNPTAKVNKMWVDHGVYNGSEKGIKIHINLDVYGMKGRSVKYCVFFYKEDNITKLVNNYGNHISASSTSTSDYDSCNWSDWTIFVPYSKIFNAANSNGRYSLDVVIQDINGKQLTRKDNYQFYKN